MGNEINVKNELIKAKLLSKIVEDKNGCWVWKAGKTKQGYGQYFLDKKNTSAHRASWIVFYGPIPDKLHVCHKCDNPPCINPQHLFLGTAKDNFQDAIKKGRVHSHTKEDGYAPKNYILSIRTTKDLIERAKKLKLNVSNTLHEALKTIVELTSEELENGNDNT